MNLNKLLNTQLNHYRELIKDVNDVETAIDTLDGVDLIYAASVIDEKFGANATYTCLYGK